MFPCHDSADADDSTPLCAMCLVRRLQEWIDEAIDAAGSRPDWWFPIAGLTASEHTLQIYIGEIPVWDSEEDDLEDLTFAYCQQAFRTAVLPLAHVASYGLAPKAP